MSASRRKHDRAFKAKVALEHCASRPSRYGRSAAWQPTQQAGAESDWDFGDSFDGHKVSPLTLSALRFL